MAKCFKTDGISIFPTQQERHQALGSKEDVGKGEVICAKVLISFRGFSISLPAQPHCSKTTAASVITKANSSGISIWSLIILILKVQNTSPLPLYHYWRDNHCFCFVLVAEGADKCAAWVCITEIPAKKLRRHPPGHPQTPAMLQPQTPNIR